MNWTLILLVSLLGVLVGIVNIFGLMDVNPYIISGVMWLLSALFLGRFAHRKYFNHGFITGIISSIVGSILVIVFWDTYVASNPKIAEQISQLPEGFDMRSVMYISSLVGAVIGGVILGLLTMLSGKVFGEPEPAKPAIPTTPPDEPNPPQA